MFRWRYDILLDPYVRIQFVPVFTFFILYAIHRLLYEGLFIYLKKQYPEYITITSSRPNGGGRTLLNNNNNNDDENQGFRRNGRSSSGLISGIAGAAGVPGLGMGMGGDHRRGGGGGVSTGTGIEGGVYNEYGSTGVTETSALIDPDNNMPIHSLYSHQRNSEIVLDGNIFESLTAAIFRIRNATKQAKLFFTLYFCLVSLMTFTVWFQTSPAGLLHKTSRVLYIILLEWVIFSISIISLCFEMILYHGDDVMRTRIVTNTLVVGLSLVTVILGWREMNYRTHFGLPSYDWHGWSP